jgi:hypothetical protein
MSLIASGDEAKAEPSSALATAAQHAASRGRGPGFWLRAAGLGLGAAFVCAMTAAAMFALSVGVEQINARGWSVLSGALLAKGFALVVIYAGFLAAFLIPFAVVIVPACYWLARKLADGLAGRMLFAFLAMLAGTFGPVAVERGLIALQAWRGESSGVRELQLSEYFTAYGLAAAPVGAFLLWPLLRRMERGDTAAKTMGDDAT